MRTSDNRPTLAASHVVASRLKQGSSRREFLRVAALGLGGALVAACMPIQKPTAAPGATTASADAAAQGAKPIIDTHIHLWKLPRNAAPMNDDATFPTGCCGEIPWLEQDALMAQYNATAGGAKIGNIVLIESSVATPPEKIIASNQWMLAEAAADPKIMSVVGKLDVTQATDSFATQLTTLSTDKHWVGVRIGGEIFAQDKEQTIANINPNVLDNLKLMAQHGLMIDTLGIHGAGVKELATAVPGLDIVMDHVAEKPYTFTVEDKWKADMEAAASAERVHVKVSDIHRLSAGELKAEWPVQFAAIADPARYTDVLMTLWKLFGPERLIFGTNWPVSVVGGKAVDVIELQINIVEAFLADKGMAARNQVMHDNAMTVYGPRA